MKIAIVHDFLNQYGGAERVVEALHEIYPSAPIYTTIYLPENLPESFKQMDIRTSFMQKLPFLDRHFKKYLLLYPWAVESFDLTDYDVILSSSSAFAKGVRTAAGTCHICYCYTPMRFAWDYKRYIEKEDFGFLLRAAIRLSTLILKKWDLKVNSTVNHFVAISELVKNRIKDIYKRSSDVIYPPVNCHSFEISNQTDNFYLVLSRLNAYKRIDIVVEAFNKLELPLKIIGGGPCMNKLRQMANKNITFTGRLSDEELVDNISKCKALIFPGIEDFGIVPLEAQSAGRPVIAFASGGALETIINGKTGIFFDYQTPESLIEAVNKFEVIKDSFVPSEIRKNALKFNKDRFKREIKEYIESKCRENIRQNAL